ncbi:MAG: pilus assembly protein PilQ [Selenomonadaceae bacterium]|nr:pilus assembly protein PilQ [Selenomonadaceae bacterium]
MIRRVLALMVLSIMISSARVSAMSLNVQEGDLHSTVMMIASMGGLNVAVDDSVKGMITIVLDDVEPIEALKVVARTKNLVLTEENNIFLLTADRANNSLRNSYTMMIRYGDAESIRSYIALALDLDEEDRDKQRGRSRLKSKSVTSLRSKTEDVSTQEYEYDYKEQDDADKKLQRVMVDKDTNAIILYGTQLEFERALKILSKLDVPLKQVSLEAKIVAINKAATKDLGIEWVWSSLPRYAEYNPSETTSVNNTTTVTESYYTREQNESTGYGVLQFGRVPNAYVPYEWYFGARLNALITDGKAKMLSKPNITTVQGHEATINVGSSVPVPTTSTTNSTVTTSYEYRDAGIILRVLPRVNADGSITATIHTEVSTPQYVADLKAYQFTTRSADTTVTMQDGEPIVIGGLIGKDEERSVRKIPFLGDLPILGALFKSVHRNKTDSELVIFLSAHVLER